MNHDELKLKIGSNITHYRKALGMTQAELEIGRASCRERV